MRARAGRFARFGAKKDGLVTWLDEVRAAVRQPWGQWSRLGLIIALLGAVVDQGFKLFMIFVVEIDKVQPIAVGPYLELVMAWNFGVSYGLLTQESDAGRWMLFAIKVAAVIGLWLWLSRVTSRLVAVSIALIIGGAIGNAIDRATWGAVADFFHVFVEEWGFSWYIFNLADVWIVAGVIGLLYDSLRPGHDDATKSSSS